MIVLSCNNLYKSFGIDSILENICFSVNEGDKIGIIGVNGTGKTTLMKIISGEYGYDEWIDIYYHKDKHEMHLQMYDENGNELHDIYIPNVSKKGAIKTIENFQKGMPSSDLSNVKDCILYTDDIENAPTNKRSVKELKDMLGNHSVYVKTANGTKNYSTVKNLLEIEMIDPIEYNRDFLFTRQTDKKLSDDGKPTKTYKVHSTYATPVMKDIFNFNYNSIEINNNTKPFKKAGNND